VKIVNYAALERRWADLERAGIPLESQEHRIGARRDLAIAACRPEYGLAAEVRELRSGAFAYVVPVCIRRETRGTTLIREFWIAPPFAGAVDLLDNSRIETRKGRPYYRFPGDSARFYTGNVLNQRIDHRLTPNHPPLNGAVLGIGSPIPEPYSNHKVIDITLGVVDQHGSELSTTLPLALHRLRAPLKGAKHSRRAPLLSRRDRIVPGNPLVAPRFEPLGSQEDVEKDVARFVAAMEQLGEAVEHARRGAKEDSEKCG
jgi:hypothetical protein